jgi:hypothetical protein
MKVAALSSPTFRRVTSTLPRAGGAKGAQEAVDALAVTDHPLRGLAGRQHDHSLRAQRGSGSRRPGRGDTVEKVRHLKNAQKFRNIVLDSGALKNTVCKIALHRKDVPQIPLLSVSQGLFQQYPDLSAVRPPAGKGRERPIADLHQRFGRLPNLSFFADAAQWRS